MLISEHCTFTVPSELRVVNSGPLKEERGGKILVIYDTLSNRKVLLIGIIEPSKVIDL